MVSAKAIVIAFVAEMKRKIKIRAKRRERLKKIIQCRRKLLKRKLAIKLIFSSIHNNSILSEIIKNYLKSTKSRSIWMKASTYNICKHNILIFLFSI